MVLSKKPQEPYVILYTDGNMYKLEKNIYVLQYLHKKYSPYDED